MKTPEPRPKGSASSEERVRRPGDRSPSRARTPRGTVCGGTRRPAFDRYDRDDSRCCTVRGDLRRAVAVDRPGPSAAITCLPQATRRYGGGWVPRSPSKRSEAVQPALGHRRCHDLGVHFGGAGLHGAGIALPGAHGHSGSCRWRVRSAQVKLPQIHGRRRGSPRRLLSTQQLRHSEGEVDGWRALRRGSHVVV